MGFLDKIFGTKENIEDEKKLLEELKKIIEVDKFFEE